MHTGLKSMYCSELLDSFVGGEKKVDEEEKKEDVDTFANFDKIFDDSLSKQEELQQLLADITQLSNPRSLHYHFTHHTLPEYFSGPKNFAIFWEIMTNGGEKNLIKDLYQATLKNYPEATCTFDVSEIHCSWHKIKSAWEDVDDFPIMVITMPKPQALTESFSACIGLLPSLDFYHHQQWRYFVLDANTTRSGTSPASILYEYIVDPDEQIKNGFLLMGVGSDWSEINDFLRELEYKWDERFYTL